MLEYICIIVFAKITQQASDCYKDPTCLACGEQEEEETSFPG